MERGDSASACEMQSCANPDGRYWYEIVWAGQEA